MRWEYFTFNRLTIYLNYHSIYFLLSQDDEVNLAKSLENNCSRVYTKLLTLEKELNLLFAATNSSNIINNNNNNDSELNK
jgi:hypothetical protein